MQRRKIYLMMVVFGVLMMMTTAIWLGSAQSASAQCGSQASSCKNCHEVQGEMPVNSDGTAWHQSHAFGDFCYICHAGINQATDKLEAHTGMVPPLADIEASCQQCHPNDLQDRAKVYATTLGIELGSGDAASDVNGTGTGGTTEATSGEADVTMPETTAPQTADALPATTVLDYDDPNLVDYAQRYDEIVLGKKPVNWGNIILIGMIAMLLVGGGGFVLKNEKLFTLSFGDTKAVSGEYPADVVDMLPALTGLKPRARRSMRRILKNPAKTEKVLNLIEAVVAEDKDKE